MCRRPTPPGAVNAHGRRRGAALGTAGWRGWRGAVNQWGAWVGGRHGGDSGGSGVSLCGGLRNRRGPRTRCGRGHRADRRSRPWPPPPSAADLYAPLPSPGGPAAGRAPRRAGGGRSGRPSRAARLACSSVSVGARSACSTGSVRTPSRRSVPGVLPDCSDSLATSRMSSDSWNATPRAWQAGVIRRTTSAGASENIAPNRLAVAISEAVLSRITAGSAPAGRRRPPARSSRRSAR